jgi:hypothetical protein
MTLLQPAAHCLLERAVSSCVLASLIVSDCCFVPGSVLESALLEHAIVHPLMHSELDLLHEALPHLECLI